MVTISRSFSLFASVVVAATMLVEVASADDSFISQNAKARMFQRRSASEQHAPRQHYAQHYARAVKLGGGQRLLRHRRRSPATPEQEAFTKKFHAQNAAWQQAAISALKAGQTPPTFDEFVGGSSGSSNQSPSQSQDSSSQDTDSSSSEGDSGMDNSSSDDSDDNDDSDDDDGDDGSDTSDDESDNNRESSSDDSTDSDNSSQQTPTDSTTKNHKSSKSSKSSENSGSNSSSSSGGDSETITGQGTYFDVGLGSCGKTNTNTDFIVAISAPLMDSLGNPSDPNNNPVCGKQIRATYRGKSVVVTVADRCAGCAWGDLDFSPSAFEQLAPKSVGRFDLSWSWVN